MSKNLPLLSIQEVSKHNHVKDCHLVPKKNLQCHRVLEEHPGGGEIILPYAGKDITEIMADIQSHQHSESAYEILDEGMLVGYLATEQEERVVKE